MKLYEESRNRMYWLLVDHLGSTRIAMREDGTLYWLLSDHLGSTSITATASGEIFSELRYSAFGEIRFAVNNTPTDYLYTGQRVDSYINMYWYRSRWYDSTLSHFVQADSIIPGMENPGSWNRYAYALWNPVRYTDSTGHYVDDGCSTEGCSIGIASTTKSVFSNHKLQRTKARLGIISDLEALARLSDFSAFVNKNDKNSYIQDLGATLTGLTNSPSMNELRAQAQQRILG